MEALSSIYGQFPLCPISRLARCSSKVEIQESGKLCPLPVTMWYSSAPTFLVGKFQRHIDSIENMDTSPTSSSFEEKVDDYFSEFNLLTRVLHNLDDRGLVLSLAAFAEDSLGALLMAFMLPSDASTKLMEGFNAPLGTFAARIKAAYSLGLINKSQFDDLERLRKIRNEFAHTWQSIEISKPNISALIKQMSYSRIDDHFPETPNEKLRSSIICLLLELSTMVKQISTQGTRLSMIGRHLMAGFSGSFEEQLQSARNLLEDILQNLKVTDADRRDFYMEKLMDYSNRMNVLGLPHKSSLESQEYLDFLEEVRVVLNQNGIVNKNSVCELHYRLKKNEEEIAYLTNALNQTAENPNNPASQ